MLNMTLKDGLSEYEVFKNLHQNQLESSGVPSHLWYTLYKKLKEEVFDAGEAFTLFNIEYEDGVRKQGEPRYKVVASKEGGLQWQDVSNIYLIDHAWTYQYKHVVDNLMQMPSLLYRMCNLMDVNSTLPDVEKVFKVVEELWLYNQSYSHSLGSVEDRCAIWYIMDEFGSAIQHSDSPNCRIVPFYFVLDQTTYSLLFLIKDMEEDEELVRDYVEGPMSKDPEVRKALLLPWKPCSFTDVPYTQTEPGEEYFSSGRVAETLATQTTTPASNHILKVYSEYEFVNAYLNNEYFEIVASPEEADILWLTKHFKEYKELGECGGKFINQFPYDNVLTVKDLFSIVCRRIENVPWLPVTYNLTTELPQFCSYFQHREAEGLDNHWICKPWNLARGLDTYITKNLNCVVRLPLTGPKIAQKYIDRPVLFNRPGIGPVKYDIRYVVLLKSVKPLVAYVYRNFFLRFSNKPFGLSELHDYEKHFTVMNYSDSVTLCKMLCNEFIAEHNIQYPECRWDKVEADIFTALRQMFEAAVMKPPPCGVAESGQSRALYAVDLMLSWTSEQQMQPMLLEVNWAPDCQRACEYYPDFYNDVFLLLFKDQVKMETFKLL